MNLREGLGGTAAGDSADALLLQLQRALALEYLSDLKSRRTDTKELIAAILEIEADAFSARQWREAEIYLCDQAAPEDAADAAALRENLLSALSERCGAHPGEIG